MGCASSKHRKRCRHCRRRYSPVSSPQSQSVHHPPQHSNDMVPLSPLSLGSLNLCDSSFEHNHKHFADFTGKLVSHENQISRNGFDHKKKSNFELQEKLKEAKAWSNMINKKIPKIVSKAPILTDMNEPETINTWEMMDGLEDVHSPPNHIKSFSFNIARNDHDHEHSNDNLKPLWLDQTDEETLDSSFSFEDFDPEIISSFRKSLQELPSDHPFHISSHDLEENDKETNEKDRITLYFTSLRGIRKTYEESCHVRIILKSLGVKVDERDVSMHSGFKDEIKELLGDHELNDGVGITLPRVFLGRKYIGGGEEIRKLNEDGKLEKLLEGCERVEENGNGNGQECEGCGDVRFVPCERCSGSCKVYSEEKEQTCPDCNENGLIRCPLCSH